MVAIAVRCVSDTPSCAAETRELEKVAERPEIQVEVAVLELELPFQLLHALLELLVGERALLHAPQRLPLHQLTQQLDEGEHELGEAAFDVLGVGVDAARE